MIGDRVRRIGDRRYPWYLDGCERGDVFGRAGHSDAGDDVDCEAVKRLVTQGGVDVETSPGDVALADDRSLGCSNERDVVAEIYGGELDKTMFGVVEVLCEPEVDVLMSSASSRSSMVTPSPVAWP